MEVEVGWRERAEGVGGSSQGCFGGGGVHGGMEGVMAVWGVVEVEVRGGGEELSIEEEVFLTMGWRTSTLMMSS